MAYGYSVRLSKLNKEADGKLLGVKLGRVCIKENIPVSYVADELAVTRQTIYNWFMGISSPQKLVAESVKTFIASHKPSK